MRCLLILAHPRRDSLCGALFDAYAAGAREAGMECRELILNELVFDPTVHTVSPEQQALEPDLLRAQRDIKWADHLVFVFPTWWGTFPALLKGFLDRVINPGFAFRHLHHGEWERLLTGRTADLLTTMDTPPLVYRFIYRAPGTYALARGTLGYCGVRTAQARIFGPVLNSTAEQRERWLTVAGDCGSRLDRGALSAVQRGSQRAVAWLAALRLQFYPMTWIAYTVGALLATTAGAFSLTRYALGYLILFLIEAVTVFLNDWFDFETDQRNRNAGPFSGGSRVLIDGKLDRDAMRTGIGLLAVGCAVTLLVLIYASPASEVGAIVAIYALLAILGIGYTAPPLQLSYRGFGEIDVAVTHGLGAIMAGYLVQGGAWTDSEPWLLALPLGISILPSILLAGCPDREADAAVGKRTLVVILGAPGAIRLAIMAAAIAPIIALLIVLARPDMAQLLGWGAAGAALHAIWLWQRLRQLASGPLPERIDGAIVLALTYMLWFCIPPLIALMRA